MTQITQIMRNKFNDIQDNTPFIITGITDDNFVSQLTYTGHTIGDVVCYSDLYDELINKFGSYSGAKSFYELCRSLINGGEYMSIFENKGGSTPYLDMTIYLEEEMNDNGLLSPYVEEWIPGKIYNIGDVVYYSIDGSSTNMVPYRLVLGEKNKTYYSGYYDETYKLLYFDDIDSDGNLLFNHWREATSTVSSSNSNVQYDGITESQLDLLKRRRSSMDDNGNILPFILHYNLEGEQGSRYKGKVLISGTTESFYMPGMVNPVVNSNGVLTCDYLKSVTLENGNTGDTIVFDTPNAEVICDESLSDFGYNKIIFEYYINATIGDDGNVVQNTGVKYVETRNVSINIMTDVTVSNQTYDFPYFNISDDYYFGGDENEDLANSGHGSSLAKITLDEEQIGKTVFSNIESFKDEGLSGVQDISSYVDVNIDRGRASSFEIHNSLGEINTMQDMEHYRNDFFKISEQ